MTTALRQASGQARALVIVPTYNERENLPPLVGALLRHPNVRVLIVDDQSPDGTGTVADGLTRTHAGRVEVMHRTGRRGLGRSYIDGIKVALREPVDIICQMDADFSHDPALLPTLIDATRDADIVIGSRYVPGGTIVNWPRRRLFLSRFANLYVRSITRMTARDCTSGYRCWRRETLASLSLDEFMSDGYAFQVETTFRAVRKGFKVKEIPIVFRDRTCGKSKISRRVLGEAIRIVWKLRKERDPTVRS